MKKTAVFTDMDNTLMYSRKRVYENDICIEKYNDKELSFMPKSVYEDLCAISFENKTDVIPVTTRTLAQYKRIHLPSTITRVCTNNGGLLLDGESAIELCNKLTNAQIQLILWFYKTVCQLTNIKAADNMFIYAVCDTPEIANQVVYARYELDDQLGNLKVVASGRKVYAMAPGMTKATVVNKLKNDYDILIAAGDSELDIPMMLQCDHAILPNERLKSMFMRELANGVWNGTPYRTKNIHCYKGGSQTFPEFIINEVKKITYDS